MQPLDCQLHQFLQRIHPLPDPGAHGKNRGTHGAEAIKKMSPIAWQHINLQGRYEFQKQPDALNVDAIIGTLIGLPVGRGLTLVA
jgi:hypothetical protein